MKEEKRTKMVPQEYLVFIAEDGKEFASKEECIIHEKIQKGTARVCPDCKGKKHRDYIVREFDPMWHPDEGYRNVERKEYGECPTCKGKGYQEKKETWE